VREAERLEKLADRALVVGDAEALADDALQINAPPAHDAVHGPVWAGLDELRDLGTLLRREAGRRALGPAVEKTLGAMLVEPVHPVAQRLSVHAADPRCLRPVHSVENRRDRQQTPALVRVPGGGRQSPELGRRIVRPQVHR
jgi:hypothetical protein